MTDEQTYGYEVLGELRRYGHPSPYNEPPEWGRPYATVEAASANAAKWAALKTREFIDYRNDMHPLHPLTGMEAIRMPKCRFKCEVGCEKCRGDNDGHTD